MKRPTLLPLLLAAALAACGETPVATSRQAPGAARFDQQANPAPDGTVTQSAAGYLGSGNKTDTTTTATPPAEGSTP